MTHIRNRAQPGVSGKGLALACLRPGAEAGGKRLTWGVGGVDSTRAVPGRVKWTGKILLQGSRMHHAKGLRGSSGMESQEAWVLVQLCR